MSNRSKTILLFILLSSSSAFLNFISSRSFGPQNPSSFVQMSSSAPPSAADGAHVPNVLVVECGFGNDSHGQNPTKAAVRACRNAIEFNSLIVTKMIPGGYEAMKVNVILAVPEKYQAGLDLNEVRKVFPYGDIKFQVQNGGMIAPSGRVIESLGDENDDMIIVCAAVQVGY